MGFRFSYAFNTYVEDGPVWEPIESQKPDTYDALWRTGLRLIAGGPYANVCYLSILECYKGNGKITRYPKDDGTTTSRDQVIASIAAMNIVDPVTAQYLCGKIKWRLSKKFSCTPSLWFWLKYIQHGAGIYNFLFQLFFYIEHFFIGFLIALPLAFLISPWALLLAIFSPIPYTLLICLICGVKNEFNKACADGYYDPQLQKEHWLTILMLRTTYPSYALLLSALMFWAVKKKSWLMVGYTLIRAPYNAPVLKMFGAPVIPEMFKVPPPMNDFWPQRHFDKTNDVTLRTIEPKDNLANDFYKAIVNQCNSSE